MSSKVKDGQGDTMIDKKDILRSSGWVKRDLIADALLDPDLTHGACRFVILDILQRPFVNTSLTEWEREWALRAAGGHDED